MTEPTRRHPRPPSFERRVLSLLETILKAVQTAPPASGTIDWTVGEPRSSASTTRSTNVAFSLQDSQQVVVTASGTDAKGNPTAGKVAFTVDQPTVLAVTDNGDGTANLVAGAEGTAILTATDTDADGNEVASTIEIDVVAGDTAAIAFSFGTPTAQ